MAKPCESYYIRKLQQSIKILKNKHLKLLKRIRRLELDKKEFENQFSIYRGPARIDLPMKIKTCNLI